jgi:hypothetical protein
MDVIVVTTSTTRLKNLLKNQRMIIGNTSIDSARYGSARTARQLMS